MGPEASGELGEFLTEFVQGQTDEEIWNSRKCRYLVHGFLNLWPKQKVLAITGVTEGWKNLA